MNEVCEVDCKAVRTNKECKYEGDFQWSVLNLLMDVKTLKSDGSEVFCSDGQVMYEEWSKKVKSR